MALKLILIIIHRRLMSVIAGVHQVYFLHRLVLGFDALVYFKKSSAKTFATIKVQNGCQCGGYLHE